MVLPATANAVDRNVDEKNIGEGVDYFGDIERCVVILVCDQLVTASKVHAYTSSHQLSVAVEGLQKPLPSVGYGKVSCKGRMMAKSRNF
jgi:hypothetical protein